MIVVVRRRILTHRAQESRSHGASPLCCNMAVVVRRRKLTVVVRRRILRKKITRCVSAILQLQSHRGGRMQGGGYLHMTYA
jgi:hypothetical protein